MIATLTDIKGPNIIQQINEQSTFLTFQWSLTFFRAIFTRKQQPGIGYARTSHIDAKAQFYNFNFKEDY